MSAPCLRPWQAIPEQLNDQTDLAVLREAKALKISTRALI